MKKAFLTLAASAITFVGCDKIANTNKEPVNPATTKEYWENLVTAIPDSIDSMKVKPVVLDAFQHKIVVKKETNEVTSSFEKSSTVVFFMKDKDTVAIGAYNDNTFIFGDKTTEDKSHVIIANGKSISGYNGNFNIQDSVDNKTVKRLLQQNKVK